MIVFQFYIYIYYNLIHSDLEFIGSHFLWWVQLVKTFIAPRYTAVPWNPRRIHHDPTWIEIHLFSPVGKDLLDSSFLRLKEKRLTKNLEHDEKSSSWWCKQHFVKKCMNESNNQSQYIIQWCPMLLVATGRKCQMPAGSYVLCKTTCGYPKHIRLYHSHIYYHSIRHLCCSKKCGILLTLLTFCMT